MKTLIINAVILSPFRKFFGNVLVSDGKISEITDGGLDISSVGPDYTIIDARGAYLSPGFIELHTHGAGGSDFMDGSIDAVRQACRTHLSHGTTAMLPTTLSSTNDELFSNVALIESLMGSHSEMPDILGTHLEGPYFSPQQNAAQDARYIKAPRPEEYKHIYANCPSIKIWSVAPELPGALEMGCWMRENGIIASIGHTDAVFQDVERAVDCGYSMITHFFNGMSRLVRKNAHMYLGVAESGLYFDDLTAEIIADGKHLPPELLKLIYKVKGPDRICLVTDSMRAAGQNVSESTLGSLKNGQRVEIEGGVAYMPGRKTFGGSVATADRLVYTMHKLAGIPLTDAVKMMTYTPARMLGVHDRLGRISCGCDADILLFDEDINIKMIMIKGVLWPPLS